MQRKERDALINKIRKFVKRDKRGHLKYKSVVLAFLQEALGTTESQHINFFERFDRLTYYKGEPKNKYYSPFAVVIYFPWESLEIICSRHTAEKIPYIRTLLNKNFEERPIAVKWIKSSKSTVQGPQIIVALGTTSSIILENGKTLNQALAQY